MSHSRGRWLRLHTNGCVKRCGKTRARDRYDGRSHRSIRNDGNIRRAMVSDERGMSRWRVLRDNSGAFETECGGLVMCDESTERRDSPGEDTGWSPESGTGADCFGARARRTRARAKKLSFGGANIAYEVAGDANARWKLKGRGGGHGCDRTRDPHGNNVNVFDSDHDDNGRLGIPDTRGTCCMGNADEE